MNEAEDSKPPSSKVNMGSRARFLSPLNPLARPIKRAWSLWCSDWSVPSIGGAIPDRRSPLSTDI